MIEAWGDTRAACLEEAVSALVELFVDTSGANAWEPIPVSFELDEDHELLVSLLEEAIYIMEVFGVIPIDTRIEDTDDGGIAGFFDTAPIKALAPTGAVPKAVSRSDLEIGNEGGLWRCRATIDV
jgi:protein archease